MSRKQVVLIGGGTRSGKSSFALTLARRLGKRRVFLATAQAGDAEMRDRIALHQRSRGADFATIEEPFAVPEVIPRHGEHDVLVLDCLTFWLANLLLQDQAFEAILHRVDDLTAVLAERTLHVVVVSSEVGMGIVPETALGRVFRDLAGMAHQRLSRLADEVYLTAMGTVLRIKPTPAFINPDEGDG